VKVAALVVVLVLVTATVALAILQPWREQEAAGELGVEHATLTPGQIMLLVVNGSEDPARVAQVILNDAFVDFRASQTSVRPGGTERITVSYPWIPGEAYDVELLTSTGRTVGYEIEEAA
jgi:ZIP family zinc transporter